jgi:hypothetical protein
MPSEKISTVSGNDTQPVIEQIQAGNFIGDRIPGMGEDYIILKVRVKTATSKKEKVQDIA